MANYLFHPEAQAEYEHAVAWYRARSPQASSRFEVETERILNSIAPNPELFPSYDDAHRFAVLKRFPNDRMAFSMRTGIARRYSEGEVAWLTHFYE